MNKLFLSLFLLITAVLAACNSSADTTPTPSPDVVAVVSTAAPTNTPKPTTTPTSIPSFTPTPTATQTLIPTSTVTPTATPTPIHPLSIEYLRQEDYPADELVIEQQLNAGSNYQRYLTSYISEGNKNYALLTVPNGAVPESGWPVIIFNHGYIPPSQYRTTERYVAYVDGFARSGYIVLRPDYRGHGNSEGHASGAYGDPGYTIDVLNAVSVMKRYPDADPERIGMWGHSMGGWITLRSMVSSPDIKAGVIWGGVVGSYDDLFTRWRRGNRPTPTPNPNRSSRYWRNSLTARYGTPAENPQFWEALSANYFLDDLSGPVQLHHARGDATVPVEFSEILYEQGQQAGMPIELNVYPGDNHNISGNFNTAMARSVAFFDRWLKQPVTLADADTPTVFTGAQPTNLRAGPGTNFDIVGTMQPGESLPIVGSNMDRTWWQVETPDGIAWVAVDVTLAARTTSVPVTDEVAGPN